MFKNITIIFLSLIPFLGFAQTIDTQLGANYNHDPELIENDMLARAGVKWVRVTPRFHNYLSGRIDPATDEGLQHVIDAKKAGYKVVFGFRFDFRANEERIPVPNSSREREVFDAVGAVLARVGGHLDIFTLGNEPNLEALDADMVYQESHEGVPLVVFTKRLLDEVVEPFYDLRPQFFRPKIYGGSTAAIYNPAIQNNEAVRGLMQMAQDDDRIDGYDLHFHITSFDEVDRGFEFARTIIKEKPFLITEFSLVHLYKKYISEQLNATEAGSAFAEKYGYDPTWKAYQWYTVVNSNKVTPEEFGAFFDSRDWFIDGYLNVYRDKFIKNGVYLATYPLIQQSAPLVVNATSPMWFINPVYMQVSLVRQEDGQLSANPLCVDDYLNWASYRPVVTALAETKDTIKLYPNPSHGMLQIDRGPVKGDLEMIIFDLKGKKVFQRVYKSDLISVNLDHLLAGMYQVKLKADGETYLKKLLIEHH